MNIANIVRRIAFDEWGGTETAVWNLSKKLNAKGYHIEILATKALCSTEQEIRDGLPIRRFNYFYPQLFLNKKNKFALDKKGGSPFSFPLYRYLRSKQFDLIHSHAMGRIAKLACKAAHQQNIPFVLSFHGGNYDVPASEMEEMLKPLKGSIGYGRILEYILGLKGDLVAQADGIICVGENEKEIVQRKFPDKPTVYIPNGVEHSHFEKKPQQSFRAKYSIPKDSRLILCISRIDYQKNQRFLVQLVQELLKQGEQVYCAIIGFVTSAPYLQAIKKDIADAHLERNIIIVEGLPPDSDLLLSAYHEADVFVLPSVHEPFGIVVLEAWSAKLPVIASSVGGLKTLVKNEKTGFLFNEKDISSLLMAYHNAMENKNALVANAYKEVCEKYSWDAVANQLQQFYQEVLYAYTRR